MSLAYFLRRVEYIEGPESSNLQSSPPGSNDWVRFIDS